MNANSKLRVIRGAAANSITTSMVVVEPTSHRNDMAVSQRQSRLPNRQRDVLLHGPLTAHDARRSRKRVSHMAALHEATCSSTPSIGSHPVDAPRVRVGHGNLPTSSIRTDESRSARCGRLQFVPQHEEGLVATMSRVELGRAVGEPPQLVRLKERCPLRVVKRNIALVHLAASELEHA